MDSQRIRAQLGLLAAAAVLVTSLGILVSHGGDNAPSAAAAVGANSQQTQSGPMTLSAPAESGATAVVQR